MKIDNIREFSSPDSLGKRVIDIEIKKDEDWYMMDPVTSTRNLRRTKLLAAEEKADPPSYILDYQVDSSRGFKRYLVKAVVDHKKLYIFTIQCDQDTYENVRSTAQDMLDSFKLLKMDKN